MVFPDVVRLGTSKPNLTKTPSEQEARQWCSKASLLWLRRGFSLKMHPSYRFVPASAEVCMSGEPLTFLLPGFSPMFSSWLHPYTNSRHIDQKSMRKCSLRKLLEPNENPDQKVFFRVRLLSLVALRVAEGCQCGQGMSPHPTMQFFCFVRAANDCVRSFCAPEGRMYAGALTSNAQAADHKKAPSSFTTRP